MIICIIFIISFIAIYWLSKFFAYSLGLAIGNAILKIFRK